MAEKKKWAPTKMFLQWCLSYLLISVIALTLLLASGYRYLDVLRDNLEYTNGIQLDMTRVWLDQKVKLLRNITAKESKAAKEKAVRAYFESKNITGANLDLAMRGCGEEMAALELDGEKIKDTKALDALVDGTYKGLVSKQTVRVDTGARFNGGGNPMTKDEIMRITDRAERRAAIAANMDLFRKGD